MGEAWHESGLGSKHALSSVVSVQSARDTVRFWRAVFGKATETLVSQWPEVFWDLQNRLPHLDSLFAKLEGLSISSDTLPRRGMERDFKREKVLRIVALQLADAARIRAELAQQSEAELQREEQELSRLLATPCILSLEPLVVSRFLKVMDSCPALAHAHQEIRKQLVVIHKKIRQELDDLRTNRKKIDGRCGTLSQMVTELAQYFWNCQMIRVFYPSPAKQYALIREIIACVSTPSCLACGKQHRLSGWRAVRARDHGKRRRVKIIGATQW